MWALLRMCLWVSDDSFFGRDTFKLVCWTTWFKRPWLEKGDKNLSIERRSDGSEEYILRPTQTFAMVKKVDSSGTIGKHFRYEINPFQLTNTPFLANVNHFDKESQCLYLQPDSHVAVMQKLTEELKWVKLSYPLSHLLLVLSIHIRSPTN